MGRGRGRRSGAAAIAGLVGTAALLAGGCGESRHANEQRPQVSTRVSITVNPREVIVEPLEVGTGPDRTQQIPQNANHAQPPLRHRHGPLDLVFVTANQTERDLQLRIRGAKEAESATVYAHSPGSFQVSLPAGSYTISAAGMPAARPAHLTVGRYRASSQNDVLLP